MRDVVDGAIGGLSLANRGIVGIGVDVEDVARWLDPSLRLDALFTSVELEHAGDGDDRARRLAGTWCAKEAVVKAVSSSAALSLREVRILRDSSGAPRPAFPEGWRELDGRVLVSISHTLSAAAAVAVMLAAPPSPS